MKLLLATFLGFWLDSAQAQHNLTLPWHTVPGYADEVTLDEHGLPYGMKFPLEEVMAARARNLQLCDKVITPHEAALNFDLSPGHLPKEARIYQCFQREAPHSGALYVTNFASVEELGQMYSDWPTEHVLKALEAMTFEHAEKGELHAQAQMGSELGIRPNSTRMLKTIEKRIDSFTGFHVGKYAHKRYLSYSNNGITMISNPLHHDGNGACCGLEKRSQNRIVTTLLYTLNDRVKGAHTLFPFLRKNGTGLAARHATDGHWKQIQDTYLKARLFSGRRAAQPVNLGIRHLADWVSRKCYALQAADSSKNPSETTLVGVRPAAGDAVLFWMKNKGALQNDPYMFHCSCPLLGGVKDGIQKFAQSKSSISTWKPSYGSENW